MAHTPGPWTTERAEESDRYALEGPEYSVARVEMFGRMQEWPANARLIAAAPDLLDALKAAVLRVTLANAEGEGDPILSAWLPDALAAIAKAEKGA